MKKLILALTLIIVTSLVKGQISFTDQSILLPAQSYNGVAMAVLDMNGDKMDDIVHLDNSKILMIEYQQADGSFSNVTVGSVSGNNQWSLCAADIDGNGVADVLCGGNFDGVHIAMADATGSSFSLSDLPDDALFLQGSCFADFNNDGSIDAFGCHDVGESKIWENDGAGNLTLSSIIDFDVSVTDDSGNYGVIWTDFDNDDDLDLYIAKCRQGVNDPLDPRRINVLFENDGNYNFTENAAAYGLDIGTQSWTADFGDYDNDGDFDIFLTSHDTNNQLLNNDGGVYTDVATLSGIGPSSFPLQSVFVDFDNDGYLDILLSGAEHELYHNNQDGTFTLLIDPFDMDDMESYALGDLNSDGFVDVYGGYANVYTNPSSTADKLWLNDANANNYIAVDLEGTASNIDAIGAKIFAYGDWGQQMREVRAGVSYGIMNSLTQYIGIGTSDEIDSLIIKWPSGIVDLVYNPNVNQLITVIEGECVAPDPGVTVIGNLEFCSGDNVTLSANNGTSWEWSNNETTQSITVNASGVYSVTIFDGPFCSSNSINFTVEVDPEELPTITSSGSLMICESESVVLTSSEASSYNWSTNDTTQSIVVNTSGEYFVETIGICDSGTSETVIVDVTDVEEPTTTGDTVSGGMGTANLMCTGVNPIWYDQETGGTIINNGNTYDIFVTETTSYWIADQLTTGIDTAYVALADSSGHGGGENNPGFNGFLIFDADQEFELISVLVYAYGGGDRTIELRDDNGVVLESVTVNIPDGESRVDLNLMVPQGNDLELGTTEDPSLHRSGDGISYPYELNGAGEITTSGFGDNWYYYFYDWEIMTQSGVCESQRVEVVATVLPNGLEEIDEHFSIYPNPSDGQLFIQSIGEIFSELMIEIIDAQGKKIFSEKIFSNSGLIELELAANSSGIYVLNVTTEFGTYSKKILIE